MTDDEKQLLVVLTKSIDMILAGLSSGAGLSDWEEMAAAWDRGTTLLRERLDSKNETSKGTGNG